MDAQATFSYSFTQFDVGGPAAQPPSMAQLIVDNTPQSPESSHRKLPEA